jgi:hypothetical protein
MLLKIGTFVSYIISIYIILVDFIAGEVAECLMGVKNEGSRDITIDYAHAMLVYQMEYNFTVQNVSGRLEESVYHGVIVIMVLRIVTRMDR